ncbi:MAG TPA: hypothetical protein VER96_26520 [Polyangiaceae bacterium]|nr:hypothetical protein [Polyangiaceae bacterium]
MTQSSSTTVGSMFRSMMHARAVVCAPVFSALLALPSLAHAQEPSVSAAAPESTAAPAEQAAPAVQADAAAPAAPAAHATPATSVAPTHDAPNSTLKLSRPRVHEGFYLRLTTGPTLLTLNGHGPYGSASLTGGGAGGMIAIGGAVAPGFVLAGMIGGSGFKAEFNGGPFEDGTVIARGKTYTASDRASGGFGMVGMMFDWYPDPSGGWHFGAAPGLGVTILTNQADHRDFGGVNFAGSAFGGYDWALGRKWSLGLQLVVSGGTQTKLVEEDHSKENDVRDTGYRLTPFSVGVQASVLYF